MKSFFSIFLIAVVICSCNKETDQPTEGNKAKLTVGNFVLNGIPVNASVAGQPITTAPVSFGQFSGTASNLYTSFTPGFGQVELTPANSTTNLLGEKDNFVFGSATAFSFLLFDTADHTIAYVMQDLLQPTDTAAKVRFFNFVPGTKTDSLTVYLIRQRLVPRGLDTLFLTKWTSTSTNLPNQMSRAYQGVDKIDYSGFNTIVQQDTSWHIHIYHNHTELIDSSQHVELDVNGIYSLFATGSYAYKSFADTALYKPTVRVVRNY